MGLLAPPRSLVWGPAALYCCAVGAAVAHHEPWADEAQAWLLARDAPLGILWTRLLHYEGTPGLWHSLLHVLIRLGLPYSGLNVVSALFGLAGIYLLLRYAPLPLWLRLLLPFTYFLCYQYAVIARSYVMVPPLLFACATLYLRLPHRLAAFTAVLCGLAAVSVHGLILAASIGLAAALEVWRKHPGFRHRLALCAAAWTLAALLLAWAAWPGGDATFVARPNWSAHHLLEAANRTVTEGLAGNSLVSWAAILLSLGFLRRGGALLPFALSATLLCLFGAVIYSQVWHAGMLFLAWLAGCWIAAGRTRPTLAASAALGVVALLQCYAAAACIRYDWSHAYSAARNTARYLDAGRLPQQRLFAIGYACTAVQPYFPRNIFANVNGGKAQAFWDWSNRNHVNRDAEYLVPLVPRPAGLMPPIRDATVRERSFRKEDHLAVTAPAPAYVLIGYKGDFERDLWTRQVTSSGYQLVRHFEGNLFWRTRILEPESFDLYRRQPAP